jgi:hypothetical protein
MSMSGESLKLRGAVALLAAAALAGCASTPSGQPGDGPPADEDGGGQQADAPETPMTPAQKAAMRVESVEFRPSSVELQVGESATVEVVALDSAGSTVQGVQIARGAQGSAADFDAATGTVTGEEPGEATLLAMVQRPARDGGEPERIIARADVTVNPLPVARLELTPPDRPIYAGTRVRVGATAFSKERKRESAEVGWSSSDADVATVNDHGLVQSRRPGTFTLTATSEGVSSEVELEVVENPIRRLEMEGPDGPLTVGDPGRFSARPLDGSGGPVSDAPVEWSVKGPDGEMSESAHVEDGVFVAEEDGLYRVTATVGSHSSTVEVAAEPRSPRRPMERVGLGPVPDRTTSDLWVFEGTDGRDYAYTGTHAEGAGGNVMYAWDVTDPSEPTLTDSVVVDARVVNDVKINETRELAVITREGASNRRNGIVILDIRTPAHPTVVTSFTENLTAGVHNVWIEGDIVYAVNDGTRALHIIDISDPRNPEQVGRWQIENEDRYLHDVTVRDGLAYLSYWNDGLVILDVGAGIAGGTATEPKEVSRYVYRGEFGSETYGNTHHAIPYGDYVFVGDEIFGCEECVNGPRGYVHVIDVSDIENPKEVAWYRVPEAGTHNLWVEDDRLYVAHYQGGLRVVDISGELRGNLYAQGREIGWFMTDASEGDGVFRPNAAMAWGPQPYEGNIFVSDMNAGLVVVDFEDDGDGAEGDGDGGGG